MSNKQPFHKILLSVLAAFLGVQSSKKAKDDFQEPSPWMFILIGVILLIIFVSVLLTVVNLVIK